MKRPTRQSIERALLGGNAFTYSNAGKPTSLQLAPESRRLFRYLLDSPLRATKDLAAEFVDGLWEAYSATDEREEEGGVDQVAQSSDQRTWRIARVRAKNFGGLNLYQGADFSWELRGESWLLDGVNGSGKSSLLGAISWAFTGQRPRDESPGPAHVPAPVVNATTGKLATWPPLASYPQLAKDLGTIPVVAVAVDLVNDQGETAVYKRFFKDGKMHVRVEGGFAVDEVFISTSMQMPLVLAGLRFKDRDGEGSLIRAVTQLTGLEELEVVGEIAEGLVHASREYASYAKKRNLPRLLADFASKMQEVRKELGALRMVIPTYDIAQAASRDGPVVELGREVVGAAASFTAALKEDIASTIDTTKSESQLDIFGALSNATNVLRGGLDAMPEWSALKELAAAVSDENVLQRINSALATAKEKIDEALRVQQRLDTDPRYQLKAVAAAWHSEHVGGDLHACPLCEQGLEHLPTLRGELDELRSADDTAQHDLRTNLLNIRETLSSGLPDRLRRVCQSPIREPRQSFLESIRLRLGEGAAHSNILTKFASLVEASLESAPSRTVDVLDPVLPAEMLADLKDLKVYMARAEAALSVVEWLTDQDAAWTTWWNGMAEPSAPAMKEDEPPSESPRVHLERLNLAMAGAIPYARAAENLREAIRLAKEALTIQAEQARRDQVIQALTPLKQLPALCQAVAKQAIEDLSGNIKTILDGMHTTERLRYEVTTFHKREGVTVRGSFSPEVSIDSSLVANTSWLRSALWAFVFALREEARDQHGVDPLPVWLFDDPQTTFDLAHRHNWASYVSGMQKGQFPAQVILATHDETFAAKLRASEIVAREALIKAASDDTGPLEVLEGSRVERCWVDVDSDRNSKDKVTAYIAAARVYLEGMLRAMLAGQGYDVKKQSVSALRQRIEELAGKGRAPWDKSTFKDLTALLKAPQLAPLQQSHHTDQDLLRYPEAKEVASRWPNLSKALLTGYRDIRDYRLLHGMPSVFLLEPPQAVLPQGFASVVKEHRLKIRGKASAFSGRMSDGTLKFEEYAEEGCNELLLAQHSAYRLSSRTLEPVAKPGDILLVHQAWTPTNRSLVVAAVRDELLARRFVVSEASSDVVVLAANALDPHEIALPVVARKESVVLHAVVGVLFDRGSTGGPSKNEVVECEGEASVRDILGRCSGLVEVVGNSAQPLALDGQLLLLGERVTNAPELRRLDGRPVIAADSDDARFFKRLRLAGDDLVILESLDGGGEYPPEILWRSGEGGSRAVKEVWEVLGVLFSLPS
ncbi:hypothetical protein ACWKW4_20855 [Hydrogenophaga borbori]